VTLFPLRSIVRSTGRRGSSKQGALGFGTIISGDRSLFNSVRLVHGIIINKKKIKALKDHLEEI